MNMKKKLILVESEMIGPKGHFLNNLIDITKTFENKFKISWLLNSKFTDEGTYIPRKVKILKSIMTNTYTRNTNKILYIFEEIFLFILNIFNIIFFLFFFLKEKNVKNYIYALKSNYFLLPKYFKSFYFVYRKLKLTKDDHIFFPTARRKDIALINFITKIDYKHPKFHIRVFLPPKNKFKGFFYYLKEIDDVLKKNRAFVYLWSNYNFNLFMKNSISKINIFKSNIPWSFYNRRFKTKNHIVGFVGDARLARGFNLLPKIIKLLERSNTEFRYLIHFSKISNDLIDTKNELYKMSKKNKKIKIIEKYADYKEFINYLKKIDIMPILHKTKEINAVTSGTLYSCIPYQIPLVVPAGTEFMKDIQKHKSYLEAKSINEIAYNIIKISKKYSFYLKNMKLNSKILKEILKKDPLRKNLI